MTSETRGHPCGEEAEMLSAVLAEVGLGLGWDLDSIVLGWLLAHGYRDWVEIGQYIEVVRRRIGKMMRTGMSK